jgi:hypothetical protein
MDAKYYVFVCGQIRVHHQYDLAGTESGHDCNMGVSRF